MLRCLSTDLLESQLFVEGAPPVAASNHDRCVAERSEPTSRSTHGVNPRVRAQRGELSWVGWVPVDVRWVSVLGSLTRARRNAALRGMR